MKTLNKAYIFSAIISIIMAASGALAYLRHDTINSPVDVSSLELSPNNKADVIQIRSKRDENTADHLQFNKIDKYAELDVSSEKTSNPYTISQNTNPDLLASEKTMNSSNVTNTEQLSQLSICAQKSKNLKRFCRRRMGSIIYWRIMFEDWQDFRVTYYSELNQTIEFDKLLREMQIHCEKDDNFYRTVCNLLNNLLNHNTKKFNEIIGKVTEGTALSAMNSGHKKQKEDLLLYVKDKILSFECNNTTMNLNNAKSATGTTNFDSTEHIYGNDNTFSTERSHRGKGTDIANSYTIESTSKTSTVSDGSSMSKIVNDGRLDMLKIKKILFMLVILKFHL